MLKEFRAFISKGNVIDLAVGVIIGTAFSKIVSSLVADVITPAIGILSGGIDLKSLSLVIGEGDKPAMLNYGLFLQSVVDFLIIAATIFLFIKLISKLRRPKEKALAAPPEAAREAQLLEEIRDLLKQQNGRV